jgi:hypothetical protein
VWWCQPAESPSLIVTLRTGFQWHPVNDLHTPSPVYDDSRNRFRPTPYFDDTLHVGRAFSDKYLRQHWGIPCSEKTLAKLACVGGGPAYHSPAIEHARTKGSATHPPVVDKRGHGLHYNGARYWHKVGAQCSSLDVAGNRLQSGADDQIVAINGGAEPDRGRGSSIDMRLLLWLCLVLLSATLTFSAWSQQGTTTARLALVIANADYANAIGSALPAGTLADADALATELRHSGFEWRASVSLAGDRTRANQGLCDTSASCRQARTWATLQRCQVLA